MTNPELILRTPRLDLVATTLEHIEIELEDPGSLGPLLGATIAAGWPPGEYDRNALEFFRDRLSTGGPSHVGWYGWYAITRDSNGCRDALVAAAGYLGPPNGGSVEIGYSVTAEARGLGYASELVDALATRALAHPDVQFVVAHTAEDNIASTQTLLRGGFRRIGPGAEPDTVEYRKDKT
jgi:RimJ/RimL family protein N-acetyltransferase